jgi:two-component system sensor kinase FixL
MAILETAVDAIIVIDEFGVIQSINPATERMFGYSRDVLEGENINRLMPMPYRAEHDAHLRRYCETGESHIIGVGREVEGQHADGSTFPIHLSVSELNVDGKRLFAGIVSDISNLKAAEQSLRQINEELEQRVQCRSKELHEANVRLWQAEKFAMLGKVSGGIAHEIRNPLNALRASAYYLRQCPDAPQTMISEHLNRIDRQITLMDQVITALLDVARLPEPRIEPCDIRSLCQTIIDAAVLPNQIQVQKTWASDLRPALVDPQQVSIVFRNLCRNACDAMPEGGVIFLSARMEDSMVVIEVVDHGIGMEPETLQRVKEPFFSTKPSGTGLGLALSAVIIEKNHGSLEVSSILAKGSTFTVRLPSVSV